MNITDDAVSKSPRTSETVTAVASSTATESFLCQSDFSPSPIYLTDRVMASAAATGAGKNSLASTRRASVSTSLSSKSRFSARVVCSGTRFCASAAAKVNVASARTTASLAPRYVTTASCVRS